MTEEERRRCIILGICGGGGGAAASEGDNHGARRAALLEQIQSKGGSVGEAVLDDLLTLIDEARKAGAE
jgi:hypothetical protein